MMAAAYHPVSGLDILHNGLCALRRSKMMSVPEFKNMFWAMERHHSDLKLAHLTGKAKDLQDHAIRDTKFYNILMKMLCELTDKRNGEQKSGLQKVYVWYMANKHALYCGPHFGKELIKEKAQKVFRKATTPREPSTRAKSAKGRSGQINKRSIPNSRNQQIYNTPRTEIGNGVIVPNFNLDYEIQKDNLSGWEMENFHYNFDDMDDNDMKIQLRTSDEDNDEELENRVESVARTPTVLVRPKTASSVTFAPFKEQSINCPEKVMSLKQGSVHSISSLVNPHTVLANELAPKDVEDEKSLPPAMKIHLENASIQRTNQSQRNKQRPRPSSSVPRGIHTRESEESVFMQQSLEEFYKTADTIKPSPRLVYTPRARAVPKSRAKSAPMRRGSDVGMTTVTSSVTPKAVQQGTNSQSANEHFSEKIMDCVSEGSVHDTGIKLDSVIHVIDSVSGDMTSLNPELLPDSQTGIKQPSVPVRDIESAMEGEGSVFIDASTIISRGENIMSPPDNTPRPFSSSMTLVKETQCVDERHSKPRCSSASAIDWRGRIQPDTVRYKWSKTQFGGHTYLKKWPQRNLRSAGSTSAGKRPKTAPTTTREKWKTKRTDNPKAVGAATHNTVIVNQDDVDAMITVQHLLGEGDRTGSFGSLDSLDEEFWRQFQKESHPASSTTPTMEFLSFITPSLTQGVDRKIQPGVTEPELVDDTVISLHGDFDGSEALKTSTDLPKYNKEALEAAVEEESLRLDEPGAPTSSFVEEEEKESDQRTHEDLVEPHVEVTTVTPGEVNPSRPIQRTLPLQELSHSDPWQFSLEEELFKHHKKGNHFCDVHLDTGDKQDMTTRVERSAGRMPSQTHSTAIQMLAFSRRYSEALRRAPPLRTPPSIPTPQNSAKAPKKRNRIFLELEHHARKTRSPRNFMQRVQSYRSMESSRSGTVISNLSNDTIVGTSLSVCRLPVSSRERSSLLSTEYEFDPNHPYLKNWDQTPYMSREPTSLHAIHENNGGIALDRQVSFANYSRVSSKPMTAPASEIRSYHGASEELRLQRNATFTSIGSKQTMISEAPSTRSLAHIGRPIAQVSKISDPDELIQAVEKQKEAAAAVDIQRIFRGYVARNIYKNLMSEERKKKEDERIAAVRIQSTYRGHLSRKSDIYNRPPLNPDLVSWGKDVSRIQAVNASKRNVKMENLSNEMTNNQRDANNKMALIGPHVEIYDIYHPKKTGPSKKELATAATKLQKVVRGWMVRRKMEKLARKATWYGSNFPKMVKEYKVMVKRVQHQHGVDKAKTPFSIKEMSDYIDTRRRYESVFDKKAFGGELERNDVEAFFRECDLYPSQAEIEEAIDVTMHGQANKRDNKGLKKKELLDMIFYIYVPPATGLEGTRQSTWMNPIINGKEARKLIGSEFVEPAPLDACAKLVIETKREQRLKEQAKAEQEKKKRLEKQRESLTGEESDMKKIKKVVLPS